MITWEPWVRGGPTTNQPNYSLSTIIAGDHDSYIRSYARSLKQINGIVYIRLMHEMNGDWYPWAGTVNGNTPAQYAVAFRHIVDIFREEGADNARWIWSLNNSDSPQWGTANFRTYYPGDNYIDFAAIDGYNWGVLATWSGWDWFADVFDDPYRAITGITQKPIIITEVGSSEDGGSKADWITNAFEKLGSDYPRITAIIWFNEADHEMDLRVESSAASLAAYRAALAGLGARSGGGGPLGSEAPRVSLNVPFVSTKISKRPVFKVKWSATSFGQKIDSYTVRYRWANSSTWRNWKTNTKSKYAYFKGSAGRTAYFRVSAKDTAGKIGWSKVRRTINPYNEGANLLSRSGFRGYRVSAKSQNYLSSIRYSYTRGNTLIYRFKNTNGVGFVTTKDSNRGRAKVYIDGKYFKTVDAHSSSLRPRQLALYHAFYKKGDHELKIVNLGTPGRARFDVDGVVAGR